MIIAYFDCFSGISGDMVLGAMVDAGLDAELLRLEIDKWAKVEQGLTTISSVNLANNASNVEYELVTVTK